MDNIDVLGDRYWSKVKRGEADECWVWLAGHDASGYGVFRTSRGVKKAHRLAYEALVGPIPDGLVIDHLCRVRGCVNPTHMEPVSIKVNSLRGYGAPARHARKAVCKNGHEFTPKNTRVNKHGARICKTCEYDWQSAYLRRKRAAESR